MLRAIHTHTLRAVPVAALLLVSCGGASPPPPEAAPASVASAAPSAAPAESDPTIGKIPTACAEGGGKVCVPPQTFVKRLCGGFFPDVALTMLGKGTPWQRGYLRVKSVEAWNASGGMSSADKIVFDEEFVIVTHREPAAGGIVVSGAGGSYDVLRWDGTCASLQDEEVSLKPAPAPRSAKIPWKSLDDKVQSTLLADEKVGRTYAERRKECKGASIGEVSLKCVKLDEQLSAAIVDYVRRGGAVPPPTKLP